MTEIPLSGGNVSSGVVRIGDTVRRPAGPWTPAVHALLGYLHAAGFGGAPRPLGLDELGREVLTFIPGTIAWPGNFDLLDPDDRVRRVARLIRDFHDAVTRFRPPPDARWQALIPAEGTGIIAHHDLAPWNLVISPRRWAFIDWDTAAPGSALWDVAYALHGFVPLSANPSYRRGDPAHRMRLFADAYGLDQAQRQQLIPCWPGGQRPCTTSSPGRRPPARSPGPGCGTQVTAAPGVRTPNTSPNGKTPGTTRSLTRAPIVPGCLSWRGALRAGVPIVRGCLSCGGACRGGVPCVRGCLACGGAYRAGVRSVPGCLSCRGCLSCQGTFRARTLTLILSLLARGGRVVAGQAWRRVRWVDGCDRRRVVAAELA